MGRALDATDAPLPAELVAQVVLAAVAAPSMLNSQPWRFVARPADRSIDVYADCARRLRHADPCGRGVHVACGAAVFNLRLAIAVAGAEPVTRLIPRSGDPLLLATVRLAARHRVQPWERDLHAAIWRRRTSRGPFTGPPVDPRVLGVLAEAAVAEGAQLLMLARTETRQVLRQSAVAGRRLHADPGYQGELDAWTDWSGNRRGEAIPLGPSPPGRLSAVRDLTAGRAPRQPGRGIRFERNPQLAMILAPSDTPGGWLRAGQAMQRVLLLATAHGLAASPLTLARGVTDSPLSHGDSRYGGYPVMILRLGHSRPGAPTPRRPVWEVLHICQAGDGSRSRLPAGADRTPAGPAAAADPAGRGSTGV